MTDSRKPATPDPAPPRQHVLYVTRTGMLEPLGQSQVLAYLRLLSSRYDITLVSFEKAEDRADRARWDKVAADCAAHGITWRPRHFHYRPRIIAPAWGIMVLLFSSLAIIALRRVSVIHARSYVPALVALAIGKVFGIPFIFDMRALWPEELIATGRVRRGSPIYRMIVWVERAALRQAAAIVSLTRAAVAHLRLVYPREMEAQRVAVIPTCADLARFAPGRAVPAAPVYGCLGTVLSGWFRLDWLAAFFAAAERRHPDARFEIVTRDDPDLVRAAIGRDAGFQSRLKIYALPPERVHEAIQQHSASAMFYADDLSRLGCSPTRMGEVLGCGLPVVTNRGVGDTTGIVQDHRVGILVDSPSAAEMDAAVEELDRLVSESDLAARCRATAEQIFSLETGAAAYAALYQAIIDEHAD